MKPNYDQLFQIAETQGGYFSAAQARQAGFSWERLSENNKVGKILRVSHGVYRLSHFPATPFEDFHIALLKSGANSVISHDSALVVYELSDLLPEEIHVTVSRTTSRRQKGIHFHTNRLDLNDVTSRDGLQITKVARTIVDVANNHLPEEQVLQAIDDALKRGLISRSELFIQAERQRGRGKLLIYKFLG